MIYQKIIKLFHKKFFPIQDNEKSAGMAGMQLKTPPQAFIYKGFTHTRLHKLTRVWAGMCGYGFIIINL